MPDYSGLASGGAAVLGGMLGSRGSIPDSHPLIETPRFMMRIEGVTSSTVEKFEGALPIMAFTWGVSRDTSPQAAGHLFSSGRIRGYNTEVIAVMSVQVMNMINAFSKGEKIPQIVIDELATIGENSVSIKTNTYDICYFVSAEGVVDPATPHSSNFMRLVFRYSAYTMEFHEFDQEGTALGSNSTTFNFRTAVGGEGGGGGGAAA